MNSLSIVRKVIGLSFVFASFAGCYAEAGGGAAPTEECRNVVRNRGEVETCNRSCNDRGCHDHCDERERYSHEHRCWME